MELPSVVEGLHPGDAPPLPDEGRELHGSPDDDILDDLFGDHLEGGRANANWLERNLADISVEDSSDYYYGALIPGLPADDFGGMDICEVCEAVAMPDSLVRHVQLPAQMRRARHAGGRTLSAPSEGRGSRQALLAGVRETRALVHKQHKHFLLEFVHQAHVEDCRTQDLL